MPVTKKKGITEVQSATHQMIFHICHSDTDRQQSLLISYERANFAIAGDFCQISCAFNHQCLTYQTRVEYQSLVTAIKITSKSCCHSSRHTCWISPTVCQVYEIPSVNRYIYSTELILSKWNCCQSTTGGRFDCQQQGKAGLTCHSNVPPWSYIYIFHWVIFPLDIPCYRPKQFSLSMWMTVIFRGKVHSHTATAILNGPLISPHCLKSNPYKFSSVIQTFPYLGRGMNYL